MKFYPRTQALSVWIVAIHPQRITRVCVTTLRSEGINQLQRARRMARLTCLQLHRAPPVVRDPQSAHPNTRPHVCICEYAIKWRAACRAAAAWPTCAGRHPGSGQRGPARWVIPRRNSVCALQLQCVVMARIPAAIRRTALRLALSARR